MWAGRDAIRDPASSTSGRFKTKLSRAQDAEGSQRPNSSLSRSVNVRRCLGSVVDPATVPRNNGHFKKPIQGVSSSSGILSGQCGEGRKLDSLSWPPLDREVMHQGWPRSPTHGGGRIMVRRRRHLVRRSGFSTRSTRTRFGARARSEGLKRGSSSGNRRRGGGRSPRGENIHTVTYPCEVVA